MLKPTVNCNQIRKKDEGKEVVLSGWVSSWRDHGGVIFIDLRDIYGKTQVVFGRDKQEMSTLDVKTKKEILKKAHSLRNEYVVSIKGKVVARPEGTVNKDIDTGEIEVTALRLEILNKCSELPFDLKKMEEVGEKTRLKYRYLEMRTGELKDNLIFKHKFMQFTRNFFSKQKFYEIETPFLTRSTPEGARDYLVPSRINRGKFYALPQSPQLFKQTLMIGGLMRYFQIVKCFRDEDLRQDRQPEFTQVDLELSFTDEHQIMEILEKYIEQLFDELLNRKIKLPIQKISYREALNKYGTDKPDLRIPLEIFDITKLAAECNFKVFSRVAETGVVRGLKISKDISRSVIDKTTREVQELGAKGLAWMKHKSEGLRSQVTKFFSSGELDEIAKKFNSKKGDIIFFMADDEYIVCKTLSYLRKKFGKPEGDDYIFSWIVDYPLVEKDRETGKWKSLHHPFTAPCEKDINKLEKNPGKVKSRAYDLVLNGSEIGGGSIRIHRKEIQDRVFDLLDIGSREREEKFGFILKALKYGAPPHGGFAFGVDRLLTRMLDLESIRDVIPFPKTQKAYSPLTDAPGKANSKQLEELGISIDIL